jgi:hypothetical protein
MNNQAFELLKAFVRVIGITFFLNAMLELSHLPEEFVYLSQGGFIFRIAVAATTALVFGCALNLVLGILFCFCSASVGRIVAKTLSSDSSSSSVSTRDA